MEMVLMCEFLGKLTRQSWYVSNMSGARSRSTKLSKQSQCRRQAWEYEVFDDGSGSLRMVLVCQVLGELHRICGYSSCLTTTLPGNVERGLADLVLGKLMRKSRCGAWVTGFKPENMETAQVDLESYWGIIQIWLACGHICVNYLYCWLIKEDSDHCGQHRFLGWALK